MSCTMVGSTSDRSTKPGGACESTLVTGVGPVGDGVSCDGADDGGGVDGGGVPVEHAVSAAHAGSSAAATRTRCTWPVYHRARPKIPQLHKLRVLRREPPATCGQLCGSRVLSRRDHEASVMIAAIMDV